MRFLSVAERELRAAARRKGLYRLRWYTAVGFFVLFLWLGWATDAFKNRSGGKDLFEVFSVLVFLYCLLVGATGTADCLSRERREGTLGLLFLTNLNSAEIIAGKLCSSILGAVYPLLAIFPILALPVLLGGIMPAQLGHTMLALLNAIFFAVTAGMVASAVSVRQFPAIALATGLALVGGLGVAGLAEVLRHFGPSKTLASAVGACCPLTTLLAADAAGGARLGMFWWSLIAVPCWSWIGLGLVAWWVARTWRDRPKRTFFWSGFSLGQRWSERSRAARKVFRTRLLGINPLFWLAGRARVSSSVFMALTVAIVLLAILVIGPLFEAAVPAGAISSVVGFTFGWGVATLALHALALYYAAFVAAQRLAEDRESGSLELILSTPTSVRTISRGLWLAFARRMFFPAVVVILAQGFLLWLVVLTTLMESPGDFPPGLTPGRLLWHLLLDQPMAGFRFNWAMAFFVRANLLALVLLLTAWITLGWVARWLGLRLKHPGFAPLTALALGFVPPGLLFGLLCYAFDQWGLSRIPERRYIPLLMWLAFVLGVQHCLLLSVWAASRLRRDLRAVATGCLEPRPRWRLPRRHTVLRLAGAAVVLPLLLTLLVVGYYGYQNWRSRRDWKAFQQELRQRGQALDLASVMPGPVPDEQNFARAEAFLNLLTVRTNTTSVGKLLGGSFNVSRVELPPVQAARNLMPWLQRLPLDLEAQFKWLDPKRAAPAISNRIESAAAVCAGLAPLAETLRALAEAASARSRFQITTNRDASVVFQDNPQELLALAHAHFLFELRASARLASGEPTGAAEDVLTSLRLVDLARQSPDASGVPRAQILLARSLQPLWEGVIEQRWNESQLATFQSELARFDLIAGYTNAVRRVVLAHLETWRAIPDSGKPSVSIPVAGGYSRREEWAWQPRAWWLDNCIQLHRASEKVLAGVDAASGKLAMTYSWSDFDGLSLDQPTQVLLQQNWWSPGPAQVALAQTAVNQTIVACALERYRLAHGDYPENLDALVPRYLEKIPPDCARGRPVFYQREGADRFTLLGFGPNGINDHGKPGTDDWLWAFPALPTNAPPPKATGRK